MFRKIEEDFLVSALEYEWGAPTTRLTDAEWDSTGLFLQSEPENWSDDFKRVMKWSPGTVVKPSNVDIYLGIACYLLSEQSKSSLPPMMGVL